MEIRHRDPAQRSGTASHSGPWVSLPDVPHRGLKDATGESTHPQSCDVRTNQRPGGVQDAEAPVLLAAVVDFGWGSIGKLRLILDELPDLTLALDGDAHWVALTRELLSPRRPTVDIRAGHRPRAAVVINDPAAANRISAQGLPVVYVDSLPYLWATPDEIPAHVTVYCAQRSPARTLPQGSPLANREDIVWVDPIVPRSRESAGGGGVVVNVGGMHSHLSMGSDRAYSDLVVVPLVRQLLDAGRSVAAVCGNLPTAAVADLRAMLGDVPLGQCSTYEFDDLLLRSDLLMTSPGSTTILQAASLRLPTVFLPPQNLSQIYNAEIFAGPDTVTIGWPSDVIDRDEVRRLSPAGEDVVLNYVYGAIVRAAASKDMAARISRDIQAAVAASADAESTLHSLVTPGASGAGQIAEILRGYLEWA